MSAVIIRGDARSLPLPDASVDLIVTSPPYYGLRSYTDGGEHYDGQIGAEATPAEYVDALLDCTREWMRVLKSTGSMWINLGDKYSTYEGSRNVPQNNAIGLKQGAASQEGKRYTRSAPTAYGIPYKSLFGLPWRYAIGCIDDLGLTLRAEVVWHKANGMPESCTDRVRRSHETWFHFVKEQRYFSAVDEIREEHTAPTRKPGANAMGGRNANLVRTSTGDYEGPNPLGKLPGSVWEIATQPLKVPAGLPQHFAAFPVEWPRRIITGWSPSGICTACGEGRRPVIDRPGLLGGDNNPNSRDGSRRRSTMDGGSREWMLRMANPDRITGYVCACPAPDAPARPAAIVDPFGGTGTTALVADVLGRHGISVDRSADYGRLAKWRTADPGERARALGLPKPPKQIDGQGDLFGEMSA
jgi:DNA modification methylase